MAISIREKSKEKRRRLILKAARGVIVDDGVEALNMRALAQAAEVSVATLYNLYGSKEEILHALLEASLDELDAAAAAPGEGLEVLDQLRALVDFSTALFISDAPFYRQLLLGLQRSSRTARPSFAATRIRALADGAFEKAINDGALSDMVAPKLLAQQLLAGYSQRVRIWAQNQITDEALKLNTAFALELILLAVVTDGQRAGVEKRIKALQKQISKTPMVPETLEDTKPAADAA